MREEERGCGMSCDQHGRTGCGEGVTGHVINMGNRLSGGVAGHVINMGQQAVERV